MSKCDLVIQFDRPDRQFTCGEPVTGTAFMRVNKNVKCRGVMVKGMWRTHGKGNRASEEYHSQNFTSGQLQAGQEYEFPFEIPTPGYPTTYHGTYLNVDHYVQLRVDIPWGFDPKLEEEFLLATTDGASYSQHLDPVDETTTKPTNLSQPLAVVGICAIAIGIFALFNTSIVFAALFGIGGIVLLAFTARRALAERKLGPVEVQNFSRRLMPGTEASGEMVFTPKSAGTINEINVELTGAEICVSGSGSNKTTHRHELFKNKTVMMQNVELTTGVPVRVPIQIEIPTTQAYTVKLGENQIQWEAVFHIDIPRWPDWVGKEQIQIIPPDSAVAFVQPDNSAATNLTGANQAAAATASAMSTEAVPAESMPDAENIPMPGLRSDLVDVASDLQNSDRFNDEAARKVELLATELFQIEVLVDRINPTHGYFSDDRYEDGQTVVGTLKGTDTDVVVQMPKEYNEQLESVHHGNIWTGQGVIIKWDALYSRLEMMGF